MKKIFLILTMLFFMGCHQSFIDVPREEYTHTTYYYTPKELFEKRISYYPSGRHILKKFGGFRKLNYEGKILSAVPKDYYILLSCEKFGKYNKVYINYENSVMHIDGSEFILKNKYLFTYEIENTVHHIVLRKQRDRNDDYIFWELERLDPEENLEILEELDSVEILDLLEDLDPLEQLDFLDKFDLEDLNIFDELELDDLF